jgi:predicted DNA-binding protein (MmcQ/YjbR family)
LPIEGVKLPIGNWKLKMPMTVDSIRRFCLSFPQTKENLQWGEDLCFKVGGKIFAVLDLGSVPQRLSFKCTPEKFAELVEQDGIIPAPYVGRYKWVLLEQLDVLPGAELEDLIRQSYEMVAKPKRRNKKSSKRRNR